MCERGAGGGDNDTKIKISLQGWIKNIIIKNRSKKVFFTSLWNYKKFQELVMRIFFIILMSNLQSSMIFCL